MMKSPSILILLFAGLLMGALPFQAFAGEKSLPAKLVGTDILIQHVRGENSVSADPSYGEFSTRALTPSTMSIRVRRGLTIILKIDRQTKDDWVRINSQAIGDFEDKRGIFLLRGELRRVISRGKHRSQRRKKIRVFHRSVAATLYEKDDEEFGLFMTAHLVIDRKQHFLELHSSFFSNARTVATEVHPVQVENLPPIGCGSEEGSHVPASSTDPHTRSSGPLKIAEIYTVADNLYGSLEPDTNAEIAARVNEANVFYENDVNVTLDIKGQTTYDSMTDPYTSSTEASTLLTDFTRPDTTYPYTYQPGSPYLLYGDSDIYHLFTGRYIGGTLTGTVGLAYVGVGH